MSRLFTTNTTDAVTVSPAVSINSLAARTLMIWAKASTFGIIDDITLFTRGLSTYTDFFVDSGNDGFLLGSLQDSGGGPTWGSLNSYLLLGQWIHIALTYDANGDNLVHTYMNGVEIAYDQHDVGTPPCG